MATRTGALAGLLIVGCVVAGPSDDPDASTGSTTGAGSATTNESESATQGQSSTTSAVTGATATTTSATGPGTSTTTGADPSITGTATGSATDGDPSAGDATTSASDTGGPRTQCGIEIDPAGGPYEAGCGCDTCDLYWEDLDQASFELIVESCDCLCEAAGCGENSGEAVAGAEADSGGRGEASSG